LNRSATPAALLAFIRSAQLGSFSAAAKQLDMSAAAVGQAVSRLENGFGVKLLNRTTRRMSLTADGKLLVERCRGLVGELDAISRVFDESRGIVSGPLRISAPAGLARRYVLPLVARFIADHPAVEVSLDCSDTVRDFAGDQIDIAFRILRPTDSTVVARRISRLEAVTSASPDYLLRRGVPSHPKDLAGHACIVYRHPGTGALAPMTFRVRGRETNISPRPGLIINDVETACEAGAQGLGVCQPPAYYAAPHLASGRLVRILERFTTAPWTLYLCYAGAKHLPQRVRAFVDFAHARFGKTPFVL
jgi:DNA-binding transcriptional LysR family regulator